jgi:type IV pilus assembly protein PilB
MITDEQLIEAGLRQGLLDAAALAGLRLSARRGRTRLLESVTHHGRFPIATLYRAFADQRGLPFLDASKITSIPSDLLRQFPAEMISFLRILPVSEEAAGIRIATDDPDNPMTRDAVARLLKRPILFALSDPATLDEAIGRLQNIQNTEQKTETAAATVESPRLLDQIFREAFVHRASDIHFSPQADGIHVRLRVDGLMQPQPTLGRDEGMSVISRVKVLAGLDIAEQRRPQDGGFSYRISPTENREIDIRVATSPTRFGERATLRLLGFSTSDLTLSMLGLPETEIERFRVAIRQPHGLILLTGPTGSGKSTTLYAALREINRPELNILTVEDPIEYHIPGVSQIEIDGTKTTFASTLRALLRHDPDVLMVGEIRDAETADVALKAATTGHLVFSTLHTSSASGAITRLLHLGCPTYLIGETLIAVLAQRLVRRLCPRCRKPRPPSAEEAAWLGGEITQVFEPSGCAACLGQGFQGRVGLFETLWVDRTLARRMTRGEAQGGEAQMTLREDGRAKVIAGVTSLDEVRAVISHHETEMELRQEL